MATIKVLIVEDSALVATILKQALESHKKVRVVGIAANGQEAIKLIPTLAPDLITMDVWMPVMDGFATVEWIMANQPTPVLVITSTNLNEDVQISLRMLAAGALDVIEKPASLIDQKEWEHYQSELTSKVVLLAGVRVIRHMRPVAAGVKPGRGPVAPGSPPPRPEKTPDLKPPDPERKVAPPVAASGPGAPNRRYFFPVVPHFQVVAIASSTGGPSALMHILRELPANLPASIMIVQHISEGFTQGLVDWLQREVNLKVKMARDGDLPRAGEILLAPDRRDMMVMSDLKIVTSPPRSSMVLCPSADMLMNSIARVYADRAVGVVLTGMGSDGALGLREMYRAGAYTIAQDQTSSLIFGMPKVAAEMGGAREVLSLRVIASRLLELLQQPASERTWRKPAKDEAGL